MTNAISIETYAADLAAEHVRNGWTGPGKDYDIGMYFGDREHVEEKLGRALSREETKELERAIRAALDATAS